MLRKEKKDSCRNSIIQGIRLETYKPTVSLGSNTDLTSTYLRKRSRLIQIFHANVLLISH